MGAPMVDLHKSSTGARAAPLVRGGSLCTGPG
jgi:hypothetical protein